jgi:peptidoglycan/xylan/chitin deacetylase (PgdA/CDA1 family)
VTAIIPAAADDRSGPETLTLAASLDQMSGHVLAAAVVRAAAAGRPGEIVLMHVGSNPDDHTTFDADALPQIISELQARGYSFVTLDALTG